MRWGALEPVVARQGKFLSSLLLDFVRRRGGGPKARFIAMLVLYLKFFTPKLGFTLILVKPFLIQIVALF